LELLQGAKNALTRYRPVSYTENNRRSKSPAIIQHLLEYGYRMWWHTGNFFNPHNFAGRADDVYENKMNVNMVCIPPGMDESIIAPGMRPVTGPDDHIMVGGGKILLSDAGDVDGR
jgi:hypothetical protein